MASRLEEHTSCLREIWLPTPNSVAFPASWFVFFILAVAEIEKVNLQIAFRDAVAATPLPSVFKEGWLRHQINAAKHP